MTERGLGPTCQLNKKIILKNKYIFFLITETAPVVSGKPPTTAATHPACPHRRLAPCPMRPPPSPAPAPADTA
jgi:hypothetical protein